MARYHLDRAAFRAHVLNAPFMVAEMDRRAMAAYEHAVSISPVRTGEYLGSFAVTSGINGGHDNDRAYAELHNYSPHAGEVEFGNGRGYHGAHVLTQALDALGR